MNELFSKYKDSPELDTIHINRLLEVLQAFGKNPSQSDCEKRINELEADGKNSNNKKQILFCFVFFLKKNLN
jgi:Ca2+-binding EF-hand superfamily protein